MSRLYLRGSSDSRMTPITARGHRTIHIELCRGSIGRSLVTLVATIAYDKAIDTYTLDITYDDHSEVKTNIHKLGE